MKKLTFIILLIGIAISCRKEEPVELPKNGIVASAFTCGNGVMDGEEEGIDCGGFACEPCVISKGSCDLFYNEKFISGSYGSGISHNFSKIEQYVSNNRLVMLATNSAQDSIRFIFSTPNPEFFKSYTVTSLDSLSEGKVYVQARLRTTLNFNTYILDVRSIYASESLDENKRVHLNRITGKSFVSFCEMDVRNFTFNQNVTIKGNISELD